MCGGGGGGGSGNQTFSWNDQIRPYWEQAMARGQDLSQTPYQQYPGQRIAGINSDQNEAMNAIRGFVNAGGNPDTIAANGNIYQTLAGNYLTGDQRNPYASALNPLANTGVGTERNQYAGTMSDPFKNVLNSGLQDITDAYNRGTRAETDKLFTLSGTYGGSAHQDAVTNNQRELGRTINNYVQPMLNDQLNRSAGLEDSYLNRDFQGQQFNKSTNAGLYENAINRGNQDFESERARQMQAIPLGQNEQNLSLQRFNALMGVGDINRGYQQDLLNQGYQDWQTQRQYPYQQLDYLTGLLSRAQGGVSPNMSFNNSGYSASPFSQILGSTLIGSQFFK